VRDRAEVMRRDVADLLEEAAAAPVEGWDFRWGWESGRVAIVKPVAWDYAELAAGALRAANAALDIGTGGDEFLDGLPDFPARLVATESWPPNVPVAARRLAPRGVTVIRTRGATGNHLQTGDEADRLPFEDGAFDLVLNRHESFAAGEVARVLMPSGRFLTQQAMSGTDQLHALLGLPRPGSLVIAFDLLLGQVMRAGLTVESAEAGYELLRFADVGALAWYLRMVPWAVPGFDMATHRDALEAAAGRELVIRQERFLLSCRRSA
jgi:SAM-dependent methyltransferase